MKSVGKGKRHVLALISVLIAVGVFLNLGSFPAGAADRAKYVFMMIGDGMALPQRNAAEIYLAASNGESLKPGIVKLNMSKFPVQGMCTTYSANSIITDSAAAGTALSTGHKTKSGVINMDQGGHESYPIISVMAKDAGMRVGIVSTVDIDHATPACYYAHQPSRSNYYEISMELSKSGFDYFAGGDVKKPTGSKKDKPSSIDAIKKAGYKRVTDRASFLALKAGDGKVMVVNPVLDKDKAMPYHMDRSASGMTLAELTRKGIELLDNPGGFFMMVEGGKIDWACHANDAVASIEDTMAFDDAVGEALAFYNEHPDETLIVVTGDHETGGLTIGFAGTQYDTFFDKLSNQKVSYQAFDRILADFKKDGNAKFEDVLPVIDNYFGLKAYSGEKLKDLEAKSQTGDMVAKAALGMALKDYEIDQLKASFVQTMLGNKERAKDDETYLLYGGYEPLTVNITHILNQKAGLAWTSYSHTGVPVPVSAIGAGSDLFGGYYDNTDIFFKTLKAMGITGREVASK